MLNPVESIAVGRRAQVHNRAALAAAQRKLRAREPDRYHAIISDDEPDDDEAPALWTEQDIVFLHWRLLQDVRDLCIPETPLATKLDTLRWVFTDPDKDSKPFSFVSCLRVVGASPLSPISFCGLIDPEEVRGRIRRSVKAWLAATLDRYPAWVREAFACDPEGVEAQLDSNPQWIDEQIQARTPQQA